MLLRNGSNGPEVEKVQEKLGLKVDGAFGPGTEAKVKEWQAKNGLSADGIIGPSSWEKLFGSPAPTSKFKLENLKGQIPDSVIAQIPDTADKFNITNPLRLAHFLAQCAHESGKFKWVVEFASGTAYEGRKDLGNNQPGDGIKFKGRGYIQLTGRANYTDFSKFCNEDCVSNPNLVAIKYPMMSAAYFFNKNNLWSICDKGSDVATVTAVTRRVNGGTNGLQERIDYFKKYYELLK